MDLMFVSGVPALDLVGTVGRWDSDRVDLVDSPARLRDWLEGSGVVDRAAPVQPMELDRTRELRAAIHRMVRATMSGTPVAAADRALVNRFAQTAPVAPTLRADGSLQRRGDTAAALSSVARSALDLLGGPERELVRECEAEQCTRVYVDRSARRSRRWCDMRVCGNRAKAQAFRRRHAADWYRRRHAAG